MQLHSYRSIHRKHNNGDPAGSGDSSNECTFKDEVFQPILEAGVKQRGEAASLCIDPTQVRPLVQIAVVTREREVRQVVAAAVLPGDNVLDVKRVEGVVFLEEVAIFAAV